jgi:RNA polymerase sigma-70 factor (ECF subfamily)
LPPSALGNAEPPSVDDADAGRVRVAVAGLPAEQQRAVLLAIVGGRNAAEISDSEGIPLGTAKTRIRTAMQRLRVALADIEDRL